MVGSESEWKTLVDAYQDAIRQNPHDIELAVRLADVERHRLREPALAKRQKLADDIIDAMVKRNSDRPEAWLARYIYRKSLKAAGEPVSSQADADLDQAIEIGKKDIAEKRGDVLLYAGQRAFEKNDRDTARKYFEEATHVDPADFRGWLRLGELAQAEGTDAARTRAVDIWSQGLAAVGHCEIDLVLPLAAALVQLKRFADAEEKLRPLDAALARLSEPGRSLVELGAARLRAGAAAAKGDTVAAATLLRDVLAATRDNSAGTIYRTQFAEAWMQLGDYYTALRFDDQAADAYESAGRLDPELAEWRKKAARAAERNGRPGEAVEHYRELAENKPNDAANWLALARASFLDQVTVGPGDRNWHEFREAFKKAVEKKGNAVALYMLEADYAAAEGRLDQSVKILEKGLARIPKAWELWQSMALVQERRKADAEVKKTLAGFEKCATSPESVPLFEARLAIEAGRLEESRAILTKALAALPDKDKTQLNNLLVELDLRQGKARTPANFWMHRRPASRRICSSSTRRLKSSPTIATGRPSR